MSPKIDMLNDHLLKELGCLNLNLARLKCLTLLMVAILRHRTVNLTILATENLTGSKNESCYRRFQRFFLNVTLCLTSVARFIIRKLPRPKDGWVLSMDRTNWKYGKRHINILTIGVVINNIAIPICWKVLPQKTKRGNSNTQQRISLLKKVLKVLKPSEIQVLTMDREFGGEKWLKWLNQQEVAYTVRVKSNTLVEGKLAHAYRSTRKRKGGYPQVKVWGMDVFFSCKTITCKGRRDERLFVISNRFSGKEALEIYKLRWGIELLFSHLKKRGFNLEGTHMTNAGKLEKLFALVSLSFLFSFGWGCVISKTRKLTKALERKSIFRRGLENILRLLNNPHLPEDDRTTFIAWLTEPTWEKFFVV